MAVEIDITAFSKDFAMTFETTHKIECTELFRSSEDI